MGNISKNGTARRVSSYLATRPRKRLLFAIAVAAVVVVGASAIGVLLFGDSKSKTPKEPKTTAIVRITAQGFEPSTLVVKPGTKVTWVNEDAETHRIAANPHPTRDSLPNLHSEILNQGQSYSYIFNKSRVIQYHDEQNPVSNGRVDIKK